MGVFGCIKRIWAYLDVCGRIGAQLALFGIFGRTRPYLRSAASVIGAPESCRRQQRRPRWARRAAGALAASVPGSCRRQHRRPCRARGAAGPLGAAARQPRSSRILLAPSAATLLGAQSSRGAGRGRRPAAQCLRRANLHPAGGGVEKMREVGIDLETLGRTWVQSPHR